MIGWKVSVGSPLKDEWQQRAFLWPLLGGKKKKSWFKTLYGEVIWPNQNLQTSWNIFCCARISLSWKNKALTADLFILQIYFIYSLFQSFEYQNKSVLLESDVRETEKRNCHSVLDHIEFKFGLITDVSVRSYDGKHHGNLPEVFPNLNFPDTE